MAVNILDLAKGYLTPNLISKASNMLGENENGISKALSGAVPTVLAGLISKATSGGGGANEILSLSKDSYRNNTPNNLTNTINSDMLGRGTGMLQKLFGDKLSAIVGAIASFAGIKNSSASSLFGLAAPVATGAVGQYATENNLDAGGLSSWLSSQKTSVMNMLPAGVGGLLNIGGLGSTTSALKDESKTTTAYVSNEYQRKSGNNWLLWLLLLVGLAVAAWYFLFRNKNDAETTTVSSDSSAVQNQSRPVDVPTTTTTVTTRESMKVKLPNGTELDAYRGGIEDQLVGFLSTDWMSLNEDSLKNRWFDFDDLNFKTASAEITPESQKQVDNIAAILKAFPKAKLKIGGYTDKTGSEPANKKLSADRAQAVKAALDKAGVGSQVTGAEGYGSAFAKYPADAPETDRVKDRRVSVSVRS